MESLQHNYIVKYKLKRGANVIEINIKSAEPLPSSAISDCYRY